MPDTEFPTLESANAEVDRILAEMPESLAAWLAVEKLSASQARKENASKLGKHWDHVGCTREAGAWIHGQREALLAAGVTRSKKVARHIVMRFARAKFVGFIRYDDDMAWAHPAVRWVAQHPALCADREDAAVIGAAAEYEKFHPCPSQLARNQFNHCANPKHAESFFMRLDRLRLEHQKLAKDVALVSDDPGLADFEAEFATMTALSCGKSADALANRRGNQV